MNKNTNKLPKTDRIQSHFPRLDNSSSSNSTPNHINPPDDDEVKVVESAPSTSSPTSSSPPSSSSSSSSSSSARHTTDPPGNDSNGNVPLPSSPASTPGATPPDAPAAPPTQKQKADPRVKHPLLPNAATTDAATSSSSGDSSHDSADRMETDESDHDDDDEAMNDTEIDSDSDATMSERNKYTRGWDTDADGFERPAKKQARRAAKQTTNRERAALDNANGGDQQQRRGDAVVTRSAGGSTQQHLAPVVASLVPLGSPIPKATVVQPSASISLSAQTSPSPAAASSAGGVSTRPPSASTRPPSGSTNAAAAAAVAAAAATSSSNSRLQRAAGQQSGEKTARYAQLTSAAEQSHYGLTATTETSLVAVITAPTSERRGTRPLWHSLYGNKERKERGAKYDPTSTISAQAVANMLRTLQVHLTQPMPRLYAEHDSAESLISALEQHLLKLDTYTDQQVQRWGLAAAAAAGAEQFAEALTAAAPDIIALTGSTKQSNYSLLLTPHSCCMSMDSPKQAAITEQRNTDTCTLRLDFPSSLVCLFAGHQLRTWKAAAPVAGSTHSNNNMQQGRAPQVAIRVEPYRRHMVTARVSGFPCGPVTPSFDDDPAKRLEPLGDWQRLRHFLRRHAPHCFLNNRYTTRPNGTTAATFLLEETYLHELHAIKDIINSPVKEGHQHELGSTRAPNLNLRVELKVRSSHTACSTCGASGHQTHDCTNRPPAGTKQCRNCFATDHIASACTATATCGLCQEKGHSSLACRLYMSHFVDITLQDGSSKPRSTCADMTIAAMRRPLSARTSASISPARPLPTDPTGHSAPQQRLASGGWAAAAGNRAPTGPTAQPPFPAQQLAPATSTSVQNTIDTSLISIITGMMDKMAEKMMEMQEKALERMKKAHEAALATTITALVTRLLDDFSKGRPLTPTQHTPDTPQHSGPFNLSPPSSNPSSPTTPPATTSPSTSTSDSTQSRQHARPGPSAQAPQPNTAARKTHNNNHNHRDGQLNNTADGQHNFNNGTNTQHNRRDGQQNNITDGSHNFHIGTATSPSTRATTSTPQQPPLPSSPPAYHAGSSTNTRMSNEQ